MSAYLLTSTIGEESRLDEGSGNLLEVAAVAAVAEFLKVEEEPMTPFLAA